MHNISAGVDLAKEEIQVCTCKKNKVQSNEAMSPEAFRHWLTTSKPMTIVFEACGTSNYWKQEAIRLGHDARIISAKLVANVRQNQKTDKNDALAILQAAQIVDVSFINGKSKQQQELQSLVRLKELASRHKVAMQNQLTALLLEFNIRVSPGQGGLKGVIDEVLEDAENEFSSSFRKALETGWQQLQLSIESVEQYEICVEKAVQQEEGCKRLLALEGVGPLNAINLYNALGCGEMGQFKTGRDAAACIGLTPIQHSSGGKIKLGTIGKYVKNKSVRSSLITGAMSAINQMLRRKAQTKKELWVQELVARRGKKCAAVALANKTIRTAFSMLAKHTEYKAELLPL